MTFSPSKSNNLYHLGGSVSGSPTMEASAIQRIEATLNNAAAAAAEADAEAAR